MSSESEVGAANPVPEHLSTVTVRLAVPDAVAGVEFYALLATYWPDVDAAWERAVAAGATVVFPLADQFYGERGGRVEDPFGRHWMLSARTEVLSHEEMLARATTD